MECKRCGSLNMIINQACWECQICGTKYGYNTDGVLIELEELSEEKLTEIKIYHDKAQDALDDENYSEALLIYEKINRIKPNDWKAFYYMSTLVIHSITNGEIQSTAEKMLINTPTVFSHINSLSSDEEKLDALSFVCNGYYNIVKYLIECSCDYYKKLKDRCPISELAKLIQENSNRCYKSWHIVYECVAQVKIKFNMENENFSSIYVKFNKNLLALDNIYLSNSNVKHLITTETINDIVSNIKEYEPEFNYNIKKAGCYVATCVYGSYNCSEVWTLRRYRDNILASKWYGRLFIRIYYAISPVIVNLFGKTKWFKKIWKKRLDHMVKKLQDKGIENTPYEDKEW